jgi:hypothetical protein
MAKTFDDMVDIILEYARTTSLFVTPASSTDPIQPSPATMSDGQFSAFFNTLHDALANAGVQTHLRLEELRAMQTWLNLESLCFARQS